MPPVNAIGGAEANEVSIDKIGVIQNRRANAVVLVIKQNGIFATPLLHFEIDRLPERIQQH